jgi:hypothetical protein
VFLSLCSATFYWVKREDGGKSRLAFLSSLNLGIVHTCWILANKKKWSQGRHLIPIYSQADPRMWRSHCLFSFPSILIFFLLHTGFARESLFFLCVFPFALYIYIYQSAFFFIYLNRHVVGHGRKSRRYHCVLYPLFQPSFFLASLSLLLLYI